MHHYPPLTQQSSKFPHVLVLHDQMLAVVLYVSIPLQQCTSEPVDHMSPPSGLHEQIYAQGKMWYHASRAHHSSPHLDSPASTFVAFGRAWAFAMWPFCTRWSGFIRTLQIATVTFCISALEVHFTVAGIFIIIPIIYWCEVGMIVKSPTFLILVFWTSVCPAPARPVVVFGLVRIKPVAAPRPKARGPHVAAFGSAQCICLKNYLFCRSAKELLLIAPETCIGVGSPDGKGENAERQLHDFE